MRVDETLRDPIRYEVNRIRRPRVFRKDVIIEIDSPAHRVKSHVLEDRPEPMCRRVDLGFVLGGEPYDLRVTPSLKVKHTA